MKRPIILVVDDAPANLKLARISLEGADYDVRAAESGEAAWQLLGTVTPELILMDVQLPNLDGYELTRRIKADPRLHHIQIIAVTAYAMKGDREAALEAGCDGYIAKPIDPILLPDLVAAQLKQCPCSIEGTRPEQPPILVVEDNPTTRKMIRVALESEGHRVQEAAEGSLALKWLEHERPRLILQDLVLPDMDGLDLLQRIRERPALDGVPVLCLSGFVSRMDEAAKALTHRFSALIVKPVDPIQLLDIIRSHLEPSAKRHTATELTGPRVLVVDNDPLQRRLAQYHLEGAGYRTQVVQDAMTALHEAERSKPDVILSDIVMPNMDGFELCLAIRAHPMLAKVPVVLISSYYSDQEDTGLAALVGATAVVARSGDWNAALQQVRDVLVARNGRSTLVPQVEPALRAVVRRTASHLEKQIRLNRQLTQQCLLLQAQLSVLAGAAATLARTSMLNGVIDDVLAVCLDLAGISKGALYLRKEGALRPIHSLGWSTSELSALENFFGHLPVLEEVIKTGEIAAVPAVSMSDADAHSILTLAGVDCALIVPVSWGDVCYGALLLGIRALEDSGQEPAAFARVLGGQLGQAIGLADAFQQLHASREQFRCLVDSMDHVTVLDRNLRIIGVHGRVASTDGVERRLYLGQHFDDITGPLNREAHHSAHASSLAGESTMYEWAYVSGKKDLKHYQSTVFPVRDATGQVSSIVRVSRDVTEQKQMQAQMMVSDRLASIGMLAAGLAHEINNPLMAISGNLELAMEALATGKATASDTGELLKDAFEASQRVETIVRDLKLFSRTESEAQISVDVNAVLESTLRMARNEIRHRAHVVTSYQAVPPVRGTESRLGQVFLNLLVNAAQAIPEGQADTNEIKISSEVEGAECVLIQISDTGSGISSAQAAKMFTPFATTKEPGIGTGLGLAICQRIVAGLGGTLTFESKVDCGTVFRVRLPIDRAPIAAVPTTRVRVTPRRRGHILVIDDDNVVGTLVRNALSSDHDVTFMNDAGQCLEELAGGARFDLILCDLMMPVISGMDFYTALQKLRPDLVDQVLFMTGGAFTPRARDFMDTMSKRCVEKPLDLCTLRALINERVR